MKILPGVITFIDQITKGYETAEEEIEARVKQLQGQFTGMLIGTDAAIQLHSEIRSHNDAIKETWGIPYAINGYISKYGSEFWVRKGI